MKVDKTVKLETINIAIGILICTIITQIGFLIFNQYSIAVFLGSLYGGSIALLNFFLMGLTIQKITNMDDQNAAKKKMQASYSTRKLLLFLLVGAGMYIAVTYEIFHWLPIILAVVYPRITIAVGSVFRKEWRTKRGDIS